MVHRLVRQGIDQCSRAIRRVRHNDLVELRLDAVINKVQTIIVTVREHLDDVSCSAKDDDDEDLSDDGWADPHESPAYLVPLGTTMRSPLRHPFPLDDDEYRLDPHPYATRKRKNGGKRRIDKGRKAKRSKQREKRRQRGHAVPVHHHQSELDGDEEMPDRDESDHSSRDLFSESPRRRKQRSRPRRVQEQSSSARVVSSSRSKENSFSIDDQGAWDNFFDDGQSCNGQQRGIESVVGRMECWLGRNSQSKRPKTNRPKRARKRDKSTPYQEPIPGESNRTRIPSNGQVLCFTDVLSLPHATSRRRMRSRRSEAHEQVGSRYANDESPPFGEDPNGSVSAPNQNGNNPAEMLQSLRDRIVSEGSRTLQDLISSNNIPALRRFAKQLESMLRLLHEAKEDPTLHDSVLGQSFLVDFPHSVLMQLVDAVMSILLPRAWGLESISEATLLALLAPLRDALALHFFLIERVSRCILLELSVQEWRCVANGERAFVSSVDPLVWEELLRTGNPTSDGQAKIRFSTFSGFLPRCEVDATWKLLAYVSQGQKESIPTRESCRWQLVTQLFTLGSLSIPNEPNVFPGPDQVSAASEDLSKLLELVRLKLLGDPPRRDTCIFDLVHRAISVQSKSIEAGCECLAWSALHTDNTAEENKDFVELLFSGHLKRAINVNELTPVGLLRGERKFMSQPLLVPSSQITRVCIQLLVSWRDNLPNENRKRLELFEKATKALMKNLQQRISNSEPTHANAFATAFAADEESSMSPARQGDLLYIETSVFAGTFCLSSCSLLERSNGLWEILSDDSMKKRRLWIAGLDESSPSGHNFDTFANHQRLEIASKAMACLFLLATGSENESSPNHVQGSLNFVLSCIITCVDLARDPWCGQCHLAIIGLAVRNVGLRPDNLKLFISNAWDMFKRSPVFNRSFSEVVGAAVCGSKEDWTLQTLLAAVVQFRSPFEADSTPASPNAAPNRTIAPQLELFDLVETSLRESIPSVRQSVSIERQSFSRQGMCLVEKRRVLICRCLAALVDPFWHRRKLKSWMIELQACRGCEQDYKYRVANCRVFIQELALRYHTGEAPTHLFAEAKTESLIFCFVVLLDLSLLQKIPSCNLARIEESAGGTAEQTAFGKLVAYGKGTLRASVLARKVSDFIPLMGAIFRDIGEETTSKLLLEYKKGNSNVMLPALERECYNRVLLFCDLVGASVDHPSLQGELLAKEVLWLLTSNLQELLATAVLHARAVEGIEASSYRQAQRLECFACCCEVLTSVLGYCFVVFPLDTLDEFVTMLMEIAEKFITPVLREDEPRLESCFSAVLQSIRKFDGNNLHRDQSTESSWNVNLSRYSKILRDSIVSRYSCYLFGAASIPRLRTPLIGAVLNRHTEDHVYETTFAAFASNPTDVSQPSTELQKHLVPFFNQLLQSQPLQLKQQLIPIRQKSIEMLIPKLHVSPKNASPKLVIFLRAVLDLSIEESSKLAEGRTFCALARALWSTARNALSGSAHIQCNVLCQVYHCLQSMAHLTVGATLALYGSTNAYNENRSPEDAYLYCVLCYFQTLGRMIGIPDKLVDLRERIRSRGSAAIVSWPLLTGSPDDLNCELNDLENNLFGTVRPIVNVYNRQKQSNIEAEPLAPDPKPTNELLEAIASFEALFMAH